MWKGGKNSGLVRAWLYPPTRMDQPQHEEEASFSTFTQVGPRIGMAGCSLCMGNQGRVPEQVTGFSTSTRTLDDRLDDGSRAFLGSAELGAVSATLGRLPTVEEYFAAYAAKIAPKTDKVYRYLQFDELPEYAQTVA